MHIWKEILVQKHRWVKLIILANVTILLAAIFLYTQRINHLISYRYDSDQLAAFTENEYDACFGGAIDDSYGAGWYDVIPDLYLRKGFYRYSISYISSAEQNYVLPYISTDYYNAMEEAITYFEEGIHSNMEELWVNLNLHAALRLNYEGTGSVVITEFTIWETSYEAQINLFYTILMLLAADLLIAIYVYRKKHVIIPQKKYIFAGLSAITLFVCYPLYVDYLIVGHDLIFHLTRIEGIKDGFLNGQFPVRINSAFYNGYGYANPILYGEIFLYIPAFLRLIGFPLSKCYNIYIILVNIFTCFGGYYCFKRIFKSDALGLAATLLYTMAPYRLMDIYLRSAVGEYTAMPFLPFVAYGLYRIYTEDVEQRKYRWSFLPLAVGLTGILQTHVLTGEIVGGIILLVCILLLPLTFKKQRFFSLVKAVMVTVGINLWFIVPFLDYALTQNIRVFEFTENKLIQDTGIFFTQLLSLFPEYAWSINLPADMGIARETSLTLGMPLVMGMMLCMVMICREGEKHKKVQGAFLLAMAILVTWMSTIYFPWDKIALRIPVLRNLITSIQYLWRFLAPATVLAAIVTGLGLSMLYSNEGKGVSVTAGLLICVLTVISGMQFMQGAIYGKDPLRLNSVKGLDTVSAAIEGEYVLSDSNIPLMKEVLEPRIYNGVMTFYDKQGTTVTFYVQDAGEDCRVLLPMLNYKGYYVESENNIVTNENLTSGENAEIRIDLPAAFSGEIKLYFREPWYWRLVEIISAICFILLIALIYRDRRGYDKS